eukprot:6202293-Pleurochrysis_carterae.AAC.5
MREKWKCTYLVPPVLVALCEDAERGEGAGDALERLRLRVSSGRAYIFLNSCEKHIVEEDISLMGVFC